MYSFHQWVVLANLSKIHMFICIVWLPDSLCTKLFCRTWRLLYFLCLWNKPLVGRYALEDVVCEGNGRETSDQSDFHDLSIEEDKWLTPCLWKVWHLGKLSPVKQLVFMEKRKNSWLKTNRNLGLWPQTFSIWHKVLTKFEKISSPANRNC